MYGYGYGYAQRRRHSLFAAGAAAWLEGETAGFAYDAQAPTAKAVAVKGHTSGNGVFNPDAFFTHAGFSTKYVFNAAGVLVPSPTAMAVSYAAVSHAARGLMVEAGRTNRLIRSSEIDNASWTKGANIAVLTDQIAGPDGLTTADLAYVSSTGAGASIQQLGSGFSLGTITARFFAKRNGWRWIQARLYDVGHRPVWFDLLNNLVGTTDAAITRAVITDVGGGWSFIELTFSTVLSNNIFLTINLVDADNSATGTASGTNGVYFAGIQMENGEAASSLIPTAGATVARAADAPNFATSTIPWSATSGNIYLNARTPRAAGTNVLWQADDGTANNRFRIERNASNEIHCIVTNGGAAQCDLNPGTIAHDTEFEVTFGWAANDFAASLNGGSVVTDTSGSLPTVTTVRLGYSSAGEQWNGNIKLVKYAP